MYRTFPDGEAGEIHAVSPRNSDVGYVLVPVCRCHVTPLPGHAIHETSRFVGRRDVDFIHDNYLGGIRDFQPIVDAFQLSEVLVDVLLGDGHAAIRMNWGRTLEA